MKTILYTSIASLMIGMAFSELPDPRDAISPPPGKEESLSQRARNFWIKSKGYMSEDQGTFLEGAQQTLADLGKDIDRVAAKTDVNAPAYFETRVQSLRQQHEHLTQQLKQLTPDAIKVRTSGPRYGFDKCVGSLEKAVDQADDEADVLNKILSPEKRNIQ